MPLLRSITITTGMLLGLTGCYQRDEPGVAVSGRVTLHGRPIESGTLQLMPDFDKKGRGATVDIVDGKFSMSRDDGPLPGEFNVILSTLEGTDAARAGGEPAGPSKPAITSRVQATTRVTIPNQASCVLLIELP